VRQDACSDDERERQGKARAERTGYMVTCACIPMWRVPREMDKFSRAAADADAVADKFHGIGGQLDVDGGDDGNGGGDKPSRGKRPALQPPPDMGVKAAKRMHNNKEDMQESAGVLGVELVRSRTKNGGDGFGGCQADAARIEARGGSVLQLGREQGHGRGQDVL